MRKHLFLLGFILYLSSEICKGQSSLNLIDNNGLRQGLWKVAPEYYFDVLSGDTVLNYFNRRIMFDIPRSYYEDHPEEREYYTYLYNYSDDTLDGPYNMLLMDSDIVESGQFYRGLRHGKISKYYSYGGDVSSMIHYCSGQRCGLWSYFRQSGEPESIESYLNDQFYGPQISFNSFPLRINAVSIHDSEGKIKTFSYYDSGQLFSLTHRDSNRTGDKYYYDIHGRMIAHQVYKKGRITKVWNIYEDKWTKKPVWFNDYGIPFEKEYLKRGQIPVKTD